MRDQFLPFLPPLIGEEEIAEVAGTLRSDWITTGPKTKHFELEFAEYVQAPAALALNSGTAALHVALAALGIGPGDAVMTSPLTFCSGVHVIEQVGARPVLVDIEEDTLNLNPEKVRDAVRELKGARLAAIMPVHLYGHPCDCDALRDIAEECGAAIIEDAAHALPAHYRGRPIGAGWAAKVPVLTAFSFYATKNLTTAEGGMLTGPEEILENARIWSLHGMTRDARKRYDAGGSWFYEVVCPGFKYNMTDVQAALGLHQLRRLSGFRARRAQIAARYDEAFDSVAGLQIPACRPAISHAWHIYALRVDPDRLGIARDAFIRQLAARRIGSSVHFIPVHLHPYYRDRYGYRPEDFPLAYREYQRLVSLPIYPRMSDRDVSDVLDAVLEIAERSSAGTLAAEAYAPMR